MGWEENQQVLGCISYGNKEKTEVGRLVSFVLNNEIFEAFSDNGNDMEREPSEGENPAWFLPMVHW